MVHGVVGEALDQVRIANLTQARQVLGCTKCDGSLGGQFFLGDVTDPASLAPAFVAVGVTELVVAVGSPPARYAAPALSPA